jgi:predicted phage terminase large subunit-like protein
MEQLDPKTIARVRAAAKKSLFFFARGILGYSDLDIKIHGPVCDMLEKYAANTRCMIVLPRTWFKSTIGSIAYPIWRAINNPNIRILIAQNSMTNAKKKVNSIKSIFETNGLLQALFPELMPDGTRPWSSECLTVNRTLASPEGTFEPAGVGTAVTSRHYDVVIEDDTVAPDFDALKGELLQPTRMEIEKAIGWHKLVHPLLLHPTRSQILVIGTRWAPEDLIGWIYKHGGNYKVISRAVREKVVDGVSIPAGKEEGGVPIWERFDESVLTELWNSMGQFAADMLYMNSPTSAINQIFKRDHIQYYEKLPQDLIYVTSLDPSPAESSQGDPDFNAIVTTAVKPSTGEIWVVYYNRERCDPGTVIDLLFNHYRAYHPMVVKIESVAYQKTLMHWINKRQEQLNERFYIEAVPNARTSKAARILGLQPWFQAGKIKIKTEHSELERELLAFDPSKSSSSHDDLIDALSMQTAAWSQIIENNQAVSENVVSNDPFNADAIIHSLIGRNKLEGQYPYDIGNMSERLSTMTKPERHRAYEELYSN